MLHIPPSQGFTYPPYGYEDYEPPPPNFYFADEDRELLEHAPKTKNRGKEWDAARVYRGKLAYEYRNDYLTRAKLEIQHQPKHPPDKLHTTGNKRKNAAKKTLAARDGKGLLTQATNLHFASLDWPHIGLSEAYDDPRLLFTYELREAVLERLTALCAGIPFRYAIELGKEKIAGELGKLHVHLVLGEVPLSLKHLAYEGSEIIKPIKAGTEVKTFAYLEKPPLFFQPYSYALFLEADETKTKRLPNLRGFRNVKRGTA